MTNREHPSNGGQGRMTAKAQNEHHEKGVEPILGKRKRSRVTSRDLLLAVTTPLSFTLHKPLDHLWVQHNIYQLFVARRLHTSEGLTTVPTHGSKNALGLKGLRQGMSFAIGILMPRLAAFVLLGRLTAMAKVAMIKEGHLITHLGLGRLLQLLLEALVFLFELFEAFGLFFVLLF